MSKGSIASVCLEEAQQQNLDSLLDCIRRVASKPPNIAVKKPLTHDHNLKVKKSTNKSVSEVVKIVCETFILKVLVVKYWSLLKKA